MTVDKDYIVDIASEFSAIDSGRIDRLVVIAALQVPASKWGDVTDYGTALLVCHMLKLDAQKGKGAVTDETIGDISRSFAAPSSGNKADGLDLTAYGTQFKQLRSTRVAGPLVT